LNQTTAGGNDNNARILNLETNEVFILQYNPSDLTVGRTNTLSQRPKQGEDSPDTRFTGGEARQLKLSTLFDSYGERTDVRDKIRPFYKLAWIDSSTQNNTTKRGRPPKCKLIWGNMPAASTPGNTAEDFTGFMTSIAVKYILYLDDGTPVRATVDFIIMEAADDADTKGTNPTSFAEPGQRYFIVRPRDTISLIAFKEYGDATQWRRIADANGLENPLALHDGQALIIPPAG